MTAGRSERCRELRRRALLGVWLIAAAVLLGRAVQVQVFEASVWQELAVDQHRTATELPAARGTIYDRDGVALAVSRERYLVEIDSDQLPDRQAVRRALEDVLGLSETESADRTDPSHTWRVVPGLYEPSVRSALEGLKGVRLTRKLHRDYPYESLSSGVLGTEQEGVGSGGIEKRFEEVLAGRPGRSIVAKDPRGNPLPGQTFEVEAPRAGGDVHLTIDLDLQEIAHQSLLEAIEKAGARGGDMIVVDPNTGEILAMVSIYDGHSNGLSVIHAPYEPGSTIKPFIVAGLLETGRASLDTQYQIGDGKLEINGRVLNDDHADSTVLSLAGVLRESSNVGMGQAVTALPPQEQYELLRDFGFGVRTGVPLPRESPGRLRHPTEWSKQSPQSVAIGYEISATPLQMTMAYASLANGGRLLEPRLVSATRSPDGTVREFAPQELRRVLREGITGALSKVLVDVVEEGTGVQAQLETFSVAGKTGTSRVYSEALRDYDPDRHFGSFVGYFPAEAPQLVMFVKLDSPSEGLYYGGATAAPVTRATMEAALAARQSPLDRGKLLELARKAEPRVGGAPVTPVRFAAATPVRPTPRRSVVGDPDWVGPAEVTLPDVSGQSIRDAYRQLHRLGFRVEVDVDSGPWRTEPEPGARWAVGDTVRLVSRRAGR